MKPRAISIGRRAAVGVLGTCLLAGCSWLPARKVPLDAATGFYQSASLTYRLDAGKLQQPLDVACVEGQTVRYEQVASSPLADQSIGTLSIIYPHPAGRGGFAQTKFTLDSSPAKPKTAPNHNPFSKKPPQPIPAVATSQVEIHEAWALDIPSGESDQYFKLLSSQNFFNTERPAPVGAQLTVNINGREVHKNWDPIVELNALVQRVRREGQLVSYVRPPVPAGSPHGQITSTKAYSDMLAKSGAADASTLAGSPADSAFSMAQPPTNPSIVARLPGAVR